MRDGSAGLRISQGVTHKYGSKLHGARAKAYHPLPNTCVSISWGILPLRSPAHGPSQCHIDEWKDYGLHPKFSCARIALKRSRDIKIAASGVFLSTVIDILLAESTNKEDSKDHIFQ